MGTQHFAHSIFLQTLLSNLGDVCLTCSLKINLVSKGLGLPFVCVLGGGVGGVPLDKFFYRVGPLDCDLF